jgi:hypothetical protein
VEGFLVVTMRIAIGGLVALVLLAAEPASALTAELARKCRDMAIMAHPPVPAGSMIGSAQAERAYFRTCVANNGNMSNDGMPQQPTTEGRGRKN